MSHLIEVLETIKGTGVGLYIHTHALDTTTPAGRAMFQMLGVFGEQTRKCSLCTLRPTNAAIQAASADGLTRSSSCLVGPYNRIAHETDALPTEGRHVRG
jgi:DNA invertase Pin-like site-specific DNA recombinase